MQTAVQTKNFVKVPESIIKHCGETIIVPEYPIAKYMTSRDADGKAIISETAKPWTNISYYDAIKAAESAGMALITDPQYISLAINVCKVGDNWTGGKVGKGKVFQGLRKWSVNEAQPNNYEPEDADERRFFYLPNGEIIYDVAGHLYSWCRAMTDCDERGIINRKFSAGSASIANAPHRSMSKGMGWFSAAGSDWSGNALIRGGCWRSSDYSGVFYLSAAGIRPASTTMLAFASPYQRTLISGHLSPRSGDFQRKKGEIMEFTPFKKLSRLSREVVITEKIDGTNASIYIGVDDDGSPVFLTGSRTRWITPENDNQGFAKWAYANKEELMLLGDRHHFGEWWGSGIQRTYGMNEKRFSLFNTARWSDEEIRPKCCHVVPVLATGIFNSIMIEQHILMLEENGSKAAPGFMKPEGIMIYHTGAGISFKKTIEKDEVPKSIANRNISTQYNKEK